MVPNVWLNGSSRSKKTPRSEEMRVPKKRGSYSLSPKNSSPLPKTVPYTLADGPSPSCRTAISVRSKTANR